MRRGQIAGLLIPVAIALGVGLVLARSRTPARDPGDARPVPLHALTHRPLVLLSRLEREGEMRMRHRWHALEPAVGRRPAVPARDAGAAAAPLLTLRGRVVSAPGPPTTRARVAWLEPSPGGEARIAGVVEAAVDGTFEIQVADAAELHLVAKDDRSRRTYFRRARPSNGDLGELALAPGAELAGVVRVHDSQRPLGLELLVVPVPPAAGALAGGGPRLSDADCRRLELLPGRVIPERDGAWRMEGLEPGPHRIQLQSLDPIPLDPADPIHSIRLPVVLHAGLAEAKGILVEAPSVDVRFEFACSWIVIEVASGGARPMDVEGDVTDTSGRVTEIHDGLDVQWGGEVPSHAMAVRPGEVYRVALWANNHAGQVWDVTAPEPGRLRVVPVRLEKLPMGSVRVRRAEATRGRGLCLELWEPASGRVAWRGYDVLDPGLGGLRIPEGTWTATLTPWEAPAATGDDLLLPDVRPLRVDAAEAATLDWNPPKGGTFRLAVATSDERGRELTLRVERPGVSARLTAVWREGLNEPRWSDEITTGAVYRGGDAYPPGEIVLHLEAEGCTPLRLPVRIVAGEVTPVQATLVALPGR